MQSTLHYSFSENADSDYLLVIIHGLFGTADNLSVVKRHFAPKVNVLSVDLPDHGQSAHLEHFSIEAAAEQLYALINQFKKARTGILGHSLGGQVAMRLALTHPQFLDDLIVADIAPVSYPSRHDAIISALKSVDLNSVNSRSDADKSLQSGIPEAGVRQFLLKSLYQDTGKQWHWRFNLNGLANSYEAIKGWQSSDAQFSEPVLFIKGGNSDYITASMQSEILQYFPAARAHVIERAGHWLHAEKPDAFNRVVEKHIFRPHQA